jgi:hypothetical protein
VRFDLSEKQMKTTRRTLTAALVLLALVVLLAACSYATEFVIVNASSQVLRVDYRVKEVPGDFAPPVTPSILPASQLSSHENQEWTRLASEQYEIDPAQRTVSVRIMPGQALLLCRMHNYRGSDASDAKRFPLEQIRMEGANGVLLLSGEQARTRFSQESRSLYRLDYK